jgi:hypothetical protein
MISERLMLFGITLIKTMTKHRSGISAQLKRRSMCSPINP